VPKLEPEFLSAEELAHRETAVLVVRWRLK
jgi:hypothetical protein